MNFVLMVITVKSVGLWKKLLLTENIHISILAVCVLTVKSKTAKKKKRLCLIVAFIQQWDMLMQHSNTVSSTENTIQTSYAICC